MRIVVGLSGGVDSALAAALLQERGWEVVGCFLKVAIDGAPCPWESDLPMAHRVAAHLNIPLIVRDVSAEYKREVLEPMIVAYRSGETPNPDATCNRWVKFDALRDVAREVGAERIATGHYARKRGQTLYATGSDPFSGFELWRGLDHTKDQSYFLWMLTQEQLAMCEFPLGEWQKEDVRAEARRRGLPNWDRASTSGVCFLGHVNLAGLLEKRPQVACARPATVMTTNGEVIGTVPSAEAFTIGQRARIAGQPAPRYVVATEPAHHRVTVSATLDDPARFVRMFTASASHWIGEPPPDFPPPPSGRGSDRGRWGTLQCTARIRHRQEPVPCTICFSPSHGEGERQGVWLRVTLDTPLTGVAPGQAIVMNDGDRVFGGAVIDRRLQ